MDVKWNDICYRFVEQFEVELNAVLGAAPDSMNSCSSFHATIERLQRNKTFDLVFNDTALQKRLVPLFVNLGINMILKKKDITWDYHLSTASTVAVAAVLSQYNFSSANVLALAVGRTAERNLFRDLNHSHQDFDGVRYFYKWSSCKCLKEKYTRMKSLPKLVRCSYCNRFKDRRQMFMCGGCQYVYYCNESCQASDYARHKVECKQLTFC